MEYRHQKEAILRIKPISQAQVVPGGRGGAKSSLMDILEDEDTHSLQPKYTQSEAIEMKRAIESLEKQENTLLETYKSRDRALQQVLEEEKSLREKIIELDCRLQTAAECETNSSSHDPRIASVQEQILEARVEVEDHKYQVNLKKAKFSPFFVVVVAVLF